MLNFFNCYQYTNVLESKMLHKLFRMLCSIFSIFFIVVTFEARTLKWQARRPRNWRGHYIV